MSEQLNILLLSDLPQKMAENDDISLGELNSIMNLQRQEAFDDNTEALHNTMSKRGSLLAAREKKENAESQLLKIISSQTGNKTMTQSAHSSSRARRSRVERGIARSRSTSRPRPDQSKPRSRSSSRHGADRNEDSRSRSRSASRHRSSKNHRGRASSQPRPDIPLDSSSRRGSSRRRPSRKADPSAAMHGSMDLVLGLNDESPRRRGVSRRKSSGDLAKSLGHLNYTAESVKMPERDRRRVRRPPERTFSDKAEGAEGSERQRRSVLKGNAKSRSQQPYKIRLPTRSLSLDNDSILVDDIKSNSRRANRSTAENPEGFENIWGDEDSARSPAVSQKGRIPRPPTSGGSGKRRPLGAHLQQDAADATYLPPDADMKSLGTMSKDTVSSGNDENRGKKTKLQKIHELQAKCDRYKKEWLDTTKDKKRLRNEVQDGRAEIMRLTKEVEAHSSETSILQTKLAETLEKLESFQSEQFKERNEYSQTAKELAESRIEFTKALNEARELKADLDKLEATLGEKNRYIVDLEDDIKRSKNNANELDADLNFAEETVLQLERDMKLLEEELREYRKLSDEKSGDNENGEKMRKVRDDTEKRMLEDREQRLREKQEKLENRIKQLEEEREKFLKNQKEKEAEVERRIRDQVESSHAKSEERMKLDQDIAGRLGALEADNKGLQGRLKSEQLDSQVKLREKDEFIANLQNELTQTKSQLSELSSDPNSTSSLKEEAESARSKANDLKDELDEVQKHNGMLADEIEELQAGAQELHSEIKSLRQEINAQKKEAEQWQRKATEWEAKSREWTDKAHLWKERAEKWEKSAKEADANGLENNDAVDPQANFLQAALERKKSSVATKTEGNKWSLGGFLAARSLSGEVPVADGEYADRIEELQTENAEQAETIKMLRSEMMKMQTMYKEKAYAAQQKMHELLQRRQEVELKNTNLMKELALARKLEYAAARDDDDDE